MDILQTVLTELDVILENLNARLMYYNKGMEEIVMDVRNCRMCGSLYNYIGGPYRGLAKVKEYIEENPGATMTMISEECDVTPEQIQRWVREDRLAFADDSPIGIPCEGCGTMIKSGRFCDKCRANMANGFSQAYAQPEPAKPQRKTDSNAKMRFFE